MPYSDFRLDIEDERLWRGDEPIHISNKAFHLLRLFVENTNRLLTKEQILDGVWGKIWVSEGLVKEYVHDLRVALGDDARCPHFIETVRGRGYRFLGGVRIESNGKEESTKRTTSSPTLRVVSLSDACGSEQSARLCRGLTDDLITDLSRFPDLIVLADDYQLADAERDNAVPNKGFTSSAADYAITGSVQVSRADVRANVRLIETTGGSVIWAEQYDRKLEDLFNVQSDIVAHVASAVGGFSGQISDTERARLKRHLPRYPKAYDLYLLAHELEAYFDREKTLQGIRLVEQALELDAEFARAWLVLGWLSWQVTIEKWSGNVDQYQRTWLDAHKKAAALDSLDPFAQMELASVRAVRGNNIGAKDALERALDLGRNQADLLIAASNYVATLLGEPARAKQLMDRGFEMLLRTPKWHYLTGLRVSYFCGEYESALEFAGHAPEFLLKSLFEILSLAQLGREEALTERRREFESLYPEFDYLNTAKLLPITAPEPMEIYLDGVAKAGLCQTAPSLRVVR